MWNIEIEEKEIVAHIPRAEAYEIRDAAILLQVAPRRVRAMLVEGVLRSCKAGPVTHESLAQQLHELSFKRAREEARSTLMRLLPRD